MVARTNQEPEDGYEMTKDEARAFFDEQARAWLGMSGPEFIRRWDAGEFDSGPERPDVMYIQALLPFGR